MAAAPWTDDPAASTVPCEQRSTRVSTEACRAAEKCIILFIIILAVDEE